MNGGQTFVVMIVAIVMIASIVKARIRYGYRNEDRPSGGRPDASAAEAERLREEVKQLKERLHVLERITVEKESSLEREFARLRDQ